MRYPGQIAGILLLSLMAHQSLSQTDIGLVAYYSFDGCDATDDTGKGADGVINGSPGCVCGVQGNALSFDGANDYVQFLGSFDILFSGDFTISFYMAPDVAAGIVDIISKGEACTPDSALTVRYEPATGALRAEIKENINSRAESRTTLAADDCWYHVAWVRSGQSLRLFVDGELEQVVQFDDPIVVDNDGIFSIANSPCLPNGELRFSGYMDELRLYNRALAPPEVTELYEPIDQILSRDTFLFLGNGVAIRLSQSCADTYLWSPPAGVVSPFDPEPVITPDMTTTYRIEMDYGFCAASDTIRLTVVDSTLLNCESVYLPNAFTPNYDGLNDTYGLSNDFFFGQFGSLQIYDRWGTRVFEGITPGERWDGTYQGEELMPGIYVYKLRYRCEGEDFIRTGSFTLIK